MTSRLTRWLTTLDNFEAKIAQLPAVRRYGRLTRATGLVLEATGLQLPLGATCVIERQEALKPAKWKVKWWALTASGCSSCRSKRLKAFCPAHASTPKYRQ